ncbi:MAG: 16S rRNA (cytosine(1402)-N(4))-methyltransferase RsmH [Acidobacteria bacterium]|nr:16S rRNA (cytosine(1402)-N(4))-methyltransferase RsmH [Acidobacteriota bacterium]
MSVGRGGTYLDATLGLGGHAFAVARRLGAQGRLIGFDKDPQALEIARRRLSPPADSGGDWPEVRLVQGSFTEIAALPAASADGLLADLGLSSLQLGDAARGFSFLAEGPLDMRMDPRTDPQTGPTAEQVVNRMDEITLAQVIYEFGEERRSRRIARAIVRARPIRNTMHLAQVISAAFRSMKPGRIHPATRTFQAIRIHVNRELEELEALLKAAPRVLRPGGRLVVISFHSLEDRRVKDALREGARAGIYRLLTPKPVTASDEEVAQNPRSRSAKLRAAEKI